MVSSTDGSATKTGWKRRASAASFSMCFRYSSKVVAPTQCSSPRASAGFNILEASIAPSALPAPTRVCSSSMKTTISPPAAAISCRTAFKRSSNSPRNFAPATMAARSSGQEPLVLQGLGHVAIDDSLGQAFDDRGLADAGLADQHRIVLGPTGQHLNGPSDLLVAADHRVEFALARHLGEVTGVLLERVVALLGAGALGLAAFADGLDGLIEALGRHAGLGQQLSGGRILGQGQGRAAAAPQRQSCRPPCRRGSRLARRAAPGPDPDRPGRRPSPRPAAACPARAWTPARACLALPPAAATRLAARPSGSSRRTFRRCSQVRR